MQVNKIKKMFNEFGYKMVETENTIVFKKGCIKVELKKVGSDWFIKAFGLCLAFQNIKEYDAYSIESMLLNTHCRMLNAR